MRGLERCFQASGEKHRGPLPRVGIEPFSRSSSRGCYKGTLYFCSLFYRGTLPPPKKKGTRALLGDQVLRDLFSAGLLGAGGFTSEPPVAG